MLLTILQTTNAATDTCLALIVLAKILWVRQHSLQELQWHNLNLSCTCTISQWSLILNFVDTAHAEVLDAVEICEILLTECHPEACTLDSWIVDNQRFNLLMVQEVRFARTDIRISQWLMNLHWLSLYILTILIVKTLLSNLSDVDFRVKVCSESLVVVTSIAVYDIEILNLIEMMLSSISCEDACYTWVETTTKNSSKTSLLKALTISPLPRILKVCLILWFIVSGIHIVASASQTSIHDCKVLIRQCEVDNEFRLIVVEQCLQLLNIVSIYLCGLDVSLISLCLNGSYQVVTFLLTTACNHKLCKNVRVLNNLKCRNGSYTSGTNHKYFAHLLLFFNV